MEVMRVREDARQLDGRVEIDDAYRGGERSGGKVGRGSENKVPFVAAVQTTPEGQPQFVCLRQQPFTHEEVSVFARSIAPSATVLSDGLWCVGAVQIVGAEHERVVTGGGKASMKLLQFKAINTFLGNLKRSLSGTCHAFDFAKYAHRYLAEAQYRFNRRFNLGSILVRLLRAACPSTPAPAHEGNHRRAGGHHGDPVGVGADLDKWVNEVGEHEGRVDVEAYRLEADTGLAVGVLAARPEAAVGSDHMLRSRSNNRAFGLGDRHDPESRVGLVHRREGAARSHRERVVARRRIGVGPDRPEPA
jgi:hypothetical protein